MHVLVKIKVAIRDSLSDKCDSCSWLSVATYMTKLRAADAIAYKI